MYVYLDESGDTGFKFHNGSSRYFVIALLLVDDPIPIHQAVHDLRHQLGKPEAYEFKFMKAHHDIRVAFFRAIRSYPFRVRILVVDKTRLEQPHLRKRETFYNHLVKMALLHDFESIAGATLIIDESFKGKGAKAGLTTYVRHELKSGSTEEARASIRVTYHPSHGDNLIQTVDMIVGASAREYERGDDQYRRLFAKKIEHVRMLPSI